MLNLKRKRKFLGPAAETACLLPATDNTGSENPNPRAKAHAEAMLKASGCARQEDSQMLQLYRVRAVSETSQL